MAGVVGGRAGSLVNSGFMPITRRLANITGNFIGSASGITAPNAQSIFVSGLQVAGLAAAGAV